jgi:hypothetical protein
LPDGNGFFAGAGLKKAAIVVAVRYSPYQELENERSRNGK